MHSTPSQRNRQKLRSSQKAASLKILEEGLHLKEPRRFLEKAFSLPTQTGILPCSWLCFTLPAWCAAMSGHPERDKAEDSEPQCSFQTLLHSSSSRPGGQWWTPQRRGGTQNHTSPSLFYKCKPFIPSTPCFHMLHCIHLPHSPRFRSP